MTDEAVEIAVSSSGGRPVLLRTEEFVDDRTRVVVSERLFQFNNQKVLRPRLVSAR